MLPPDIGENLMLSRETLPHTTSRRPAA
jgi:hypothetical protein